MELIRLRGLTGFTMDELASRSGLSKATVYRHFLSKESMIEATLDDFMQNSRQYIRHILATEPSADRIMESFLTYLASRAQFLVNVQVVKELKQHYPHIYDRMEEARLEILNSVLDQIARQYPDCTAGIDFRIVSATMVASFRSVLNPEFLLDNGLTIEQAIRQLTKMWLSFFSHTPFHPSCP